MLDTADAASRNNLGVALQRAGQLAKAASAYQAAVALAPGLAAAHNNLGNVLMLQGQAAAATERYETALALDPDHAGTHNNLGNALAALGRLDEAVARYRHGLRLRPDDVEALVNLGNTLTSLGRPVEAAACHARALGLRPGHVAARIGLGDAHKRVGRLAEAARQYQAAGPSGAARALQLLYRLDDRSGFADLLSQAARRSPDDILVAAIAAFVCRQWSIANPHPFCPDPLRCISLHDLNAKLATAGVTPDRLADTLAALPSGWEPAGKSTRHGFQTAGNLFEQDIAGLEVVRRAIFQSIAAYRQRFSAAEYGLIRRWPDALRLTGWSVRLQQGGYQEAHIHPTGWLSGVLYLRMTAAEAEQGALELTLRAFDYPVVEPNIPRLVFRPKPGELVLFPSSLFHRTIPFESDEERICLAFDLMPVSRSDRYRT